MEDKLRIIGNSVMCNTHFTNERFLANSQPEIFDIVNLVDVVSKSKFRCCKSESVWHMRRVVVIHDKEYYIKIMLSLFAYVLSRTLCLSYLKFRA